MSAGFSGCDGGRIKNGGDPVVWCVWWARAGVVMYGVRAGVCGCAIQGMTGSTAVPCLAQLVSWWPVLSKQLRGGPGASLPPTTGRLGLVVAAVAGCTTAEA